MAEGLRIGRILIEGFKGFTDAQEIEMRHRHVFLIGPNGNGKSSIVEAVRWGLFGSTNRPNDIVKNEGYAGDCRVEIDFSAQDGKAWRLRRILNTGGGGSRATLFDEDRAEHSIREVLPQMDSLDAGEGTHIIFSTSVGALRRQPEDLTAFESTVFDHLGLKHPRAMLSHLRAFIEGQEEVEESLDRSVSDARRQIDVRREDLERRRGQILASWGPSPPPSRPETKDRVQELIEKIKPEEDVRELSLESLVDEAESALEERTNAGREPLDKDLQELGAQLDRLALIQTAEQELGDCERELRAAKTSLVAALGGESMDELQERVRSEGQQLETSHLRHQLGSIALKLLERQDSEGSTPCLCPVCGVQRGQEELRTAMSGMTRPDGEVEDSGLRALEARLKEAMGVEDEVQEWAIRVEKARADLEEMIAGEPNEKLREAIREDRAAAYRQSTCERRKSVEAQVTDLDTWLREVRTDLRKLRDETDYHAIQRSLRDLGAVDAEMQGVQKAYNSLVTFGQSTRDICDAVESTLTETLRDKMPSVSAALTSAFRALTKHPYYDCLAIDDMKLPKLELCVASSEDPSRQRHPIGVLNGQAQSALALVPYFALSQSPEALTEVYLVLLDDPTRAFDREHIEILIGELADLGKRVQVVVATQETEAFLSLLPTSFDPGSYVVVEPGDWSYAGGPKLATTYG